VALNQPAAFFSVMHRVGAARTVKHILAFYSNPATWQEKADFIFERSIFMQERAGNLDRDMRDIAKAQMAAGKFGGAQASYFWFTALMDKAVCIPAWLAEYEKVMSETEGDETKAVQAADAVVRQTQGSGFTSDLAYVQRAGEPMKLWTMFYSYFNVVFNEIAVDVATTRSVADTARFIGTVMFNIILPAIVSELLVGRWPDPEEEEKEKIPWLIRVPLGYAASTMVGVRDIAKAVLMSQPYEMIPLGDAVGSMLRIKPALGKLSQDADNSELWQKAADAIINTVGYWKGLPTKQFLIAFDGLWDYLTGEEAELRIRDLLFYKRK
jgi:hypothetical protein